MRYKCIVITGATVIVIVFLLLILMYYFNQDECPVGTFLCQNNTICMPQRSWCNGKVDCPGGDDENEINCFDSHGFWDWYNDPKNRTTSELICDSTNSPPRCNYDNCRVSCTGYSTIPQSFSVNVTKITLTNNTLTFLSVMALSKYSKLKVLYLDNNNIFMLESNSFKNQNELIWLILSNNKIQEVQLGNFVGLVSLEKLQLKNNNISKADFSDFENSTSLEEIDLNRNSLRTSNLKFAYLPALKELNLNENQLEYIPPDLFSGLPNLKSLSIEENHIRVIDAAAFRYLTQLIELILSYNDVTTIPSNVFQPMKNLTKLSLGYNPIDSIPTVLFNPLRNLQSLDVDGIDMDHADKNMFNAFANLSFIYFKKFHYCTTYAPKVKKCHPNSDGVSSLSHLLGKPLLRAAVWSISIVTCVANVLVIWQRFTAKDENRVLSIVIRNLAVSDMLMGIYLFVIAVEDLRYRDSYYQFANWWMSSKFCTFIGILAMTSSEVSVMILSFLSVERFILITAPLKRHHVMTPQAVFLTMIIVWVAGVTLALIPAIYWKSSTRFYGVNGMCFPLHIDDPFLVGWQYSAFIFLGLNLLGLMIIIYVYFSMFASICKTRIATPLSIGDSEFALRFFLIVFTDAACWAPIIVLKIFALMNYPVPPDLHAWVVVFILPVNSAINPLLYTFTTPKFRERLSEACLGIMQSYVSKKHSTQESSQISTSISNKITMPTITTYSEEHKVPPITSFIDSEVLNRDLHQNTCNIK